MFSNLLLLGLTLLLGAAYTTAQLRCDDEDLAVCFRLSSDAEKTPFSTLEDVELSGRCLTQCAVEVGKSSMFT